MTALNKYIASSGFCSRRKAVDYIKESIVKVNDQIINEPYYKVNADDMVTIKSKVIVPQKFKYFLLNKPKNVICTLYDPQKRKTIADLFSHFEERIYPVGRLDRNTTGVIIMTNDGMFTQKLAHPKYEVKKIYNVTLDKAISPYHFSKLTQGLKLFDGFMKVDSVYYNNPRHKRSVSVVIHSGKNHIVKRLFKEIGFKVLKLDRPFFGGLTKKNLPVGTYRKLTKQEVDQLKNKKEIESEAKSTHSAPRRVSTKKPMSKWPTRKPESFGKFKRSTNNRRKSTSSSSRSKKPSGRRSTRRTSGKRRHS